MITLTVNGEKHEVDVDPDTPLLYVLRGELQMSGAKFGCGLGQCGACTVLIDDRPVFSCLVPTAAVGERLVRTIEGLRAGDKPGVLPAAFEAEQAAQCGYCIAGMVMRAQALLERTTTPTESELRRHMATNLCRCGTHMRILAAVRRAAHAMGGGVKDDLP
jgi:nicotinate dehydrogenase subunit A